MAETRFDVVICGGGLAGLTLAKQLRMDMPDRTVAVVERTARPLPESCHKVGESSVELGSQYLESLGLYDYLRDNHIYKFGLRFFPGGGQLPIAERTELGPAQEPIVASYQIDRGIFENDLRQMIVDDGVTLIEGASVSEVALGEGDADHCVHVTRGDVTRELHCRWVVDATGRNALLRRRMKLKRGTRHDAASGWFRIKGKLDIADLVPESATDWHGQHFAKDRWRSTNHFMGAGYWLWLIPLSSGNTSVGVVVHDDTHSFDDVRTLERTMAFIAEHEPVVHAALAKADVMDFGAINHYSNSVSRAWSPDRWALVGEAGAFVDPLYSPGTDFIAFANRFTGELMRVDAAGEDLDQRCRELNVQYRALVGCAVDIFRNAASLYGHARGMAAKIYWDNFAYWNFTCQYFLQRIYTTTGSFHTSVVSGPGMRFAELTNYAQALLTGWVARAPEAPTAGFSAMPGFPSVLIDSHMALQDRLTPAETLAYMNKRVAEGEAIIAELVLRVVQELAPETATELLAELRFERWGVTFSDERLAAEELVGLARRKRLPALARDVERSLGRVRYHRRAAESRALLRRSEAAA